MRGEHVLRGGVAMACAMMRKDLGEAWPSGASESGWLIARSTGSTGGATGPASDAAAAGVRALASAGRGRSPGEQGGLSLAPLTYQFHRPAEDIDLGVGGYKARAKPILLVQVSDLHAHQKMT